MLSPPAALIYAMVVAAEAERGIAREHVEVIAALARHLPIFDGLDPRWVGALAMRCSAQLRGSGGSDEVYRQIRKALPGRLREAAYALCCDVVALCRPRPHQEALERIRVPLDVDPAMARTIERAARKRIEAAEGLDELRNLRTRRHGHRAACRNANIPSRCGGARPAG